MNEEDNKNESSESDDRNERSRSWTGYLFAFLASILAASASLLIKINPEDKMLIVLMRSMLQFLTLLPVTTYKRIDLIGGDLKTLGLMILRGCLATTAINTYVEALKYLPLGDTGAITYTYPVFVNIFAWMCLKGWSFLYINASFLILIQSNQ